jgi:16S rRNA (guanine527-N7)-methyltransferase
MATATGRVAGGGQARADQLLRRGLDRLGIRPTPEQLEALAVYRAELLRWAARVNLTGFRSEETLIREGILRSLSFRAAFEPVPGLPAIDIGSGAGLPGLVLKICFPEIDMLLIDAARRRVTFLRHVVRQLGLTGIRCVQARAESLHDAAEHRGMYRLAFARAVGPLSEVVELAAPLLAPGGRLVVLFGQETARALQGLSARLAVLGMNVAVVQSPAIDEEGPPIQLLVLERPLQ